MRADLSDLEKEATSFRRDDKDEIEEEIEITKKRIKKIEDDLRAL